MAASVVIGRNICHLAKIFSGISISGSRAPTAFRVQRRCKIIRNYANVTYSGFSNPLPSTSTVCIHTDTFSEYIPPPITVTEEPDTLYQKVTVLVKCHDRAVLDSYEFFVTLAAKELGITLGKVFEPPKNIERFTLLKSIHIFKKHRVQYEMRTHYRSIELCHLTGSTAQVYLEYIQRNLPEGVAMEVMKTSMEKVPEHILKPMWKNQTTEEKQGL